MHKKKDLHEKTITKNQCEIHQNWFHQYSLRHKHNVSPCPVSNFLRYVCRMYVYTLWVYYTTNSCCNLSGLNLKATIVYPHSPIGRIPSQFLCPTSSSGIRYVWKICHCLKKANSDRRSVEEQTSLFLEITPTTMISITTMTIKNNNNNNINDLLTRWVQFDSLYIALQKLWSKTIAQWHVLNFFTICSSFAGYYCKVAAAVLQLLTIGAFN